MGSIFTSKAQLQDGEEVGLFIKESLSISICKKFDLNIPNCEDMWIQLDLGNNNKCIVGVIYRHPKTEIIRVLQEF